MLILVPGQVVGSVHVSPVDLLWDVSEDLPGIWGGLDLLVDRREGSLAATASLLKEAFWLVGGVSSWVVLRLRHGVDSLIIIWVILLLLSSDMPLWLSPGVLGSSP